MKIRLNGTDHQVPDREEISVAGLLKRLDLGEQAVLVEVNGEALYAREFSKKLIHGGDVVEIVRMVAGG